MKARPATNVQLQLVFAGGVRPGRVPANVRLIAATSPAMMAGIRRRISSTSAMCYLLPVAPGILRQLAAVVVDMGMYVRLRRVDVDNVLHAPLSLRPHEILIAAPLVIVASGFPQGIRYGYDVIASG